MKRILLLMVLLCIIFSQPVYANDRWYWVASNDTENAYFDTQTIRVENKRTNNLQLHLWAKFTYNQEGINELAQSKYAAGNNSVNWYNVAYSLDEVSISLNDSSVLFHTTYYYDKDNKIIYSLYKQEYTGWIQPPPGSMGEKIVTSAIIYAGNNINAIGTR